MFRRPITCGFAFFLLFSAPAARALDEKLPQELTANLGPLGREPDWNALEKYQTTITHDEFVHLLEQVYGSHGYKPELIQIEPDAARILTRTGTKDYFVLHFAKSEADRRPVPHLVDRAERIAGSGGGGAARRLSHRARSRPSRRSLGPDGRALVQIDDAPPVQEGDMTLRVARCLAPRLESLGAKVSFVRQKTEPVTPCRPSDFEEIARQLLLRSGITDPRENFDGPADPAKEQTIGWQRELLFYRNSEIRRRALLVNDRLRPDLVLCLHFNAEPWGDPSHPKLVQSNHLHLLVNGAYLPPELELDDERFEMLEKLLSQSFPEELDLAETIAGMMAKATGLPPYHYETENVTPVGSSGYVYARNLLATRLYQCPTVYLEPYVMNSREVFARLEAGEYEGNAGGCGENKAEHLPGIREQRRRRHAGILQADATTPVAWVAGSGRSSTVAASGTASSATARRPPRADLRS